MAVPKKKKSYSKVKQRYTKNNIISFNNRKLDYSLLNLMNLLIKKDNWIPLSFLKQIKKKYNKIK